MNWQTRSLANAAELCVQGVNGGTQNEHKGRRNSQRHNTVWVCTMNFDCYIMLINPDRRHRGEMG